MGDEPELVAPPLHSPLSNSSTPRDLEPSPEEIEKLRKWQEDRIARKLRGEYESAVLHLSEVINNNLTTPLRIVSVRVEGADKTRQSFLGRIITPFLHTSSASPFAPDNGSTLESVLHTTRHIGSLLQETDIFQTVEARLQHSRDIWAQPGDVDVVFKTREKGRFYLSTSTQVGNNEGGASATCRVRNAFGGAETFEANLSFATKTRMSFQASLSAPLTADLKTRGEISVFGMERDHSSFASCSEGVRGLKAIVRGGTLGTGLHEFGYEAALRHIGNLTPSASISMREAAGQTIKSSLFHTFVHDTRDDPLVGSRGRYVRVFNELAGLGGDASFFKSETLTQLSRRLAPGTTLSLSGRMGLLWPLGGGRSLFSDRFQLGGPTNMRIFRANGMGPRDGPDSLGGDLYWAAGLSLISDIPRKPHWPVKTHAFVNIGRLDAIDKSKVFADTLKENLTKPSVSAGVGLVYKLDPVRVEVNFGVPLVASASDSSRKGLHVGIGLEFL